MCVVTHSSCATDHHVYLSGSQPGAPGTERDTGGIVHQREETSGKG